LQTLAPRTPVPGRGGGSKDTTDKSKHTRDVSIAGPSSSRSKFDMLTMREVNARSRVSCHAREPRDAPQPHKQPTRRSTISWTASWGARFCYLSRIVPVSPHVGASKLASNGERQREPLGHMAPRAFLTTTHTHTRDIAVFGHSFITPRCRPRREDDPQGWSAMPGAEA